MRRKKSVSGKKDSGGWEGKNKREVEIKGKEEGGERKVMRGEV